MPLYRIEIPGKGTFRVESPTELTDEQAYQAALENADQPAPKDKSGFVPALKSGIAGLKADTAATLGRTGVIDTDKAAQYMREQDEAGRAAFEPTKDGWTESPWLKIKELLGGSLPYMAAPIAAGAAAAAIPATGPAAAVVGALGAGAASAAQFTGSNLSRQVDEGKQLGQTDLGGAAAAAVPQAALDVVSLRMAPLIRGWIGAAGKNVTEDVAKKIAEQGLARTLADYVMSTGKAATAEGLTEAAQQVLERLQAGLSIDDPAARAEYIESLIGGAVLGGTLAVPGRAVERGRERGQAEHVRQAEEGRIAAERQAQEQQAAQQRAAMLASPTPEFAAQVEQEFIELQAQVNELKKAANMKPADLAEAALRNDAKRDLAALHKDPETQRKVAAYRAIKPYLDAKKAQEAAAAAQANAAAHRDTVATGDEVQAANQQAELAAQQAVPQETQAQPFFQAPQGTLPGMEPAPAGAAPAPDDTAATARVFAEKQREMEQLLQNHQQQESDAAAAGNIEGLKRLRARGVLLQNEYEFVTKQLQALGGAPVEGDVVAVIKKEVEAQKAKLAQMAGPGYDPAKADKILARIDELEKQLKASGYAGQPTGQGKLSLKATKAPVSEDRASFGSRVYEPGAPDIEAQEAAALEESRRADDEAAAEAERERRVAPEAAALQRIAQKPAPAGVNERAAVDKLVGALPKEGGEKKYPSSPIGQMKQLQLGEEVTYTAEEQPGPAPKPQRVAGEGFRLYNKQGEPTRPRSHKDIAQRLASALARQDLSPEAYALLRRAEQQLPQSDVAFKEDRVAADNRQRVRRDTASEEGLLTLLDKQLTLIEQGRQDFTYKSDGEAATVATSKEGLPGKGAERRVTYEAFPVGDTRVQKTKNEIERTTLRGPSAAAPALSLAKPLDAVLRKLEAMNVNSAEVQGELFKTQGLANSSAAFRRLLNSPYVRKLKKQLADARQNLQARWNRESPPLLEKVKQLKTRIAEMEKAQADYKEAETVLKEEAANTAAWRDVQAIRAGLTKNVVTRMELAGQLEMLQKQRRELDGELQHVKEGVEPGLAADLRKDLDSRIGEAEKALQDTADDLAEIEFVLNRADAVIKVSNAQQRLSFLHEKAPFPIEIDKAREELRAAQNELGELKAAASEEFKKLQTEAGERRRAQAAVDKSKAAQALFDKRLQEQRELAARYRQDGEARTYDMISDAQRNARENPAQARAAVEADLHGANPQKVLGGYRANVRKLQKKIANAIETSRAYMLKELEPLANRLDNLDRAYKNTRTAAQRDVIGPLLDKARAEYDKRASNISSDTVTWVGMAKDRHDLELAEAKLEHLEDLIREGKVGETRPVLPAERPSAARRETQAAQRASEENAEAAKRADAPTTSGDPLETSQARKKAAQTKTKYSSKGVGQEGLSKDRQDALQRAQARQQAGLPLNAFDEYTLEQEKRRVEEALRRVATDQNVLQELAASKQGRKVGGKNAAEAMEKVASTTADPLRKAIAERLAKLLKNTSIEYVHDLRDTDGNAVHGLASVDGAVIKIDTVDGGREDTLIHEGVHAATERLLRADEKTLTEDQLAAKRELQALYDNYKNRRGVENKNAKASLSEFVAEALSDAALQRYLADHKWTMRNMWESLKAGILKLFGIKVPDNMLAATLAAADKLMTRVPRATGEASTEFLAKPKYAAAYAGAADVSGKLFEHEKSVRERVFRAGRGLEFAVQYVDRFAALEEASKYMDAVKGSQMMYYQRMFDQRFHHVAQAVGIGAPQLRKLTRADGRTEFLIEAEQGASLRSVFEALKPAAKIVGSVDAATEMLTMYQSYFRAQSKGIEALNMGGRITMADLKRVHDLVQADPKLKEAMEAARAQYNQFNRNMMQFLAQSGAVSKDEAARLVANDDYIPWYRARGGVAELVIGNEPPIKIGNLKDQPHLQELVGGDTPIFNIVDSSVQNTNMLVSMAMHNLATKSAAFELRDAGMAEVHKAGKAGAPAGPDIVTFKEDGVTMWARVQTDAKGIPADLLVKGMAGIPTQVTGLLRFFGAPAKLLRTTITSTPLYAARQLIRDSLAAPILSGADFTPLLGAARQIQRPRFLGGSGEAHVLDKRGVTGGQVFTGTQEDLKGILRRIAGGKPGFIKAWSFFQGMSMTADALTRRAQYNSYRAQGLSEMEATLMSLESMNFTKRGVSPSIHMANTVIPFFNAQIQGLNVLYKALRGRLPFSERLRIKEKLYTRGLVLMGASLAYAAAMQDDEAYKNATPEQKYGHWFVRFSGMDEPLKIPVPFEIGYIFKALPEALYNTMTSDLGADEALKAFRHILTNTVPGGSSYGVPALAKPMIEVGLNSSFYTGEDLLSKREQGLEPEAQFRANTTELVKSVGKTFGVSPIKIEHLVRGYTSTLGIAAMAAVSEFIPASDSPERAVRRWSEVPMVSGAVQPNDAAGIITDTYERMQEFSKVKATVDELLKRGEKAQALELLERKSTEYAKAELADFFTSNMNELTKAEGAIRASDRTPQEKRDLLDKVRQAKIKLASAVRDASSKTTPR